MKLKITKIEREGLKKVFHNFGREKTEEQIFYDLCFCICSPQTTFKNNIKAIDELRREDFYNLQLKSMDSEGNLYFYGGKYFNIYNILKPTRFYKQKMWRLIEAKENYGTITRMISLWIHSELEKEDFNSHEFRNWLVKNVKGLGMKTASHFLRNLGETELAIIDTHIIKFLNVTIDGIKKDKNNKITYLRGTNTKKNYLIWEKIFQNIAKENNLNPAELDALIWKRYSKNSWDAFKW